MQRTQKIDHESTSGWIARSGSDLVTEFGEEKGKKLMERRREQGLWYQSDDFPDDHLEAWYYMPKAKELTKRQCVSDQATVKAQVDLDNEMLKALTDENGVMRAGCLPDMKTVTAAGQKALYDALSEGVAKAPKPKRDPAPKGKEGSELAKPKTPAELAQDLMADILAESTAARKKSMSLGAVNYAGELSAQLLNHAEKLEKDYKTLQKAVSGNVMTDDFYQKCFAQISKRRSWYATAEAIGIHVKNVLYQRILNPQFHLLWSKVLILENQILVCHR